VELHNFNGLWLQTTSHYDQIKTLIPIGEKVIYLTRDDQEFIYKKYTQSQQSNIYQLLSTKKTNYLEFFEDDESREFLRKYKEDQEKHETSCESGEDSSSVGE